MSTRATQFTILSQIETAGRQMPRYYFHLQYGDQLVVDEVGLQIQNGHVARAEVLKCVREVLNEPALDYEDVDGQRFLISDEDGAAVMVVSF